MRNDPRLMLRGVAKFVGVVIAAGLAGAVIGIALAKITGSDSSDEPAPTAATQPTTARTQPSTTALTSTAPAQPSTTARTSTAPAQTTGGRTSTTAAAGTVYRVPSVQVLSARLVTKEDGGATVAARVRVTNRGARPLTITTHELVSQGDVVPLDPNRDETRPLLRAIKRGASATGIVLFTVSPAIARRLTAVPAARLRMANRTVLLKLETPDAAGTTTTAG